MRTGITRFKSLLSMEAGQVTLGPPPSLRISGLTRLLAQGRMKQRREQLREKQLWVPITEKRGIYIFFKKNQYFSRGLGRRTKSAMDDFQHAGGLCNGPQGRKMQNLANQPRICPMEYMELPQITSSPITLLSMVEVIL